MRTFVRIALAAALGLALLSSTGCMIRREPLPGAGEIRSRTSGLALGEATRAEINVFMGAGELAVAAAPLGRDVFRGEFEFSPAALEPEITSDTFGETIDVTVRQAETRGFPLGSTVRNSWDLELAENVPMTLRVDLGAGQFDLDLSGLQITDLVATMGAGDATIDLSGPREDDLSGIITAGVGDLTIRLPERVGVRVSGYADGIGEWEYEGFERRGDSFVNEAYGTAATSIELDVQRGIGVVRLELVD